MAEVFFAGAFFAVAFLAVDFLAVDFLAVERFAADTAKNAAAKKAFDQSVSCGYETRIVKKLSELTDRIAEKGDELQSAEISLRDAGDVIAESAMIRDKVLPKMCELRVACDEAETITAKSYWPFPTYADILFSVR